MYPRVSTQLTRHHRCQQHCKVQYGRGAERDRNRQTQCKRSSRFSLTFCIFSFPEKVDNEDNERRRSNHKRGSGHCSRSCSVNGSGCGLAAGGGGSAQGLLLLLRGITVTCWLRAAFCVNRIIARAAAADRTTIKPIPCARPLTLSPPRPLALGRFTWCRTRTTTQGGR